MRELKDFELGNVAGGAVPAIVWGGVILVGFVAGYIHAHDNASEADERAAESDG